MGRKIHKIISKPRLFERLVSSNGIDTENLLIDSIAHHLELILNSRYEDALSVPDYGIPIEAITYKPGEHGGILNAVSYAIRKYEPRLQKPIVRQIKSDEQDLEIVIEIEGIVADELGEKKRYFQGKFNVWGTAKVRYV